MSERDASASVDSGAAIDVGALFDSVAAAAPVEPSRSKLAARAAHAGSRVLYWLPVFAAMILFAQMSLFGLRPALCEQRRLADAAIVLDERANDALELRSRIVSQLAARADPIFRERQRRVRQAELLARPQLLARQ